LRAAGAEVCCSLRASLPVPLYERLKESFAGAAYQARKRHFHGSELFSRWLRKQMLISEGTQDVDKFLVELPESAVFK